MLSIHRPSSPPPRSYGRGSSQPASDGGGPPHPPPASPGSNDAAPPQPRRPPYRDGRTVDARRPTPKTQSASTAPPSLRTFCTGAGYLGQHRTVEVVLT